MVSQCHANSGNTNAEFVTFIFKLSTRMTSRNWCITINNPEWTPIIITEEMKEVLKVLIYQLEEGLNGTIHVQGYLETFSPVRLSKIKNLFPKVHAERRKGNRLQAVQYVTKEDTRKDGPWIYHHKGLSLEEYIGSLSSSKERRSSLEDIKAKLDGGCSENIIADEFFTDWVRHFKAFREYKLLKTKPRNSFDKLIVILGPSGTGKSKFCMDQYPNAYWKQRSNWWDGYNGEEVVILDEFYGWLPFDLLLRLCDRYPLLLERKGGQVQCEATTVVITSNLVPQDWYQKGYKPALYRRISTILYMPEMETTVHFKNMEEFIKSNVEIPKE